MRGLEGWAVGIVTATLLFAESAAGSGELAPWVGVGTTLGGSAFVAGVAWYLLTKQLPAMQDKHDKALASQQQTFKETLETQRSAARAAIEALQASFERGMERQQLTFEKAIREQAEKADKNEETRRADGKAGLDAILEHCERERVALAAEVQAMGQQNQQLVQSVEDMRADLAGYGVQFTRKKRPPFGPTGTTT